MYKIIEQKQVGKINQSRCEDGLFISKDIIAVIDGGSPKGQLTWDDGNKTSGWYAKDLIMKALKHVDASWSNKKIIEYINTSLTKAYNHQEQFFYDNPQEQLQAGIVFYNDLKKEIISYGDCQILINKQLYDHAKFLDVLSTGLRSFYLHLDDLNAIQPKPKNRHQFGREIIADFIKKQSYFSNLDKPFGFPVINGLKLNHKLTVVHQVKKHDEIVLSSDGYIKLLPTLKASEAYLKQYLKADPECYKKFMSTKGVLPKYKSFDDRTYIRFKIV